MILCCHQICVHKHRFSHTKMVEILCIRKSSSQLVLDFAHAMIKSQKVAPGEARTHDLQIMRLTRCLLRYGSTNLKVNTLIFWRGE